MLGLSSLKSQRVYWARPELSLLGNLAGAFTRGGSRRIKSRALAIVRCLWRTTCVAQEFVETSEELSSEGRALRVIAECFAVSLKGWQNTMKQLFKCLQPKRTIAASL